MFFEPFRPTKSHPWTLEFARHLARRSSFHASPAALERWQAMGPRAAVSEIVGHPDSDPQLQRLRRSRSGALIDYAADSEHARAELMRADWIFRMVHGSHGFQQRLVLFWHDHFAVQESKITYSALVHGYLETLREVAGKPFPEVLLAVAQSPSMLKYLDNSISTREAPNENWARELMELYALGLDRYGQEDVVELARVFTGWTVAPNERERFVFDPEKHDTGDKLLLGQRIEGIPGPRGVEEGEQALRIIAAQPACARHLATGLIRTFADPNPPSEAVDALAEVLRQNGLDVRAALGILFASKWFYAPERLHNLVRSPAVWVVSMARALEIRNPDLAHGHPACRRMGMDLLEPPSVGGWDHGQDWFGPMAADGRAYWAQRVAALPHSPHPVHGAAALDFDSLWNGGDGKDLIRGLLNRLGLVESMDGELDALHSHWLELMDRPDETKWPTEFRRRAARMAVLMVLSLPETCIA